MDSWADFDDIIHKKIKHIVLEVRSAKPPAMLKKFLGQFWKKSVGNSFPIINAM